MHMLPNGQCENLVLTQKMYETLWSSNLLPVGARSSQNVFTSRDEDLDWPYVMLTKGRGMPYPTIWVDDLQRQLGVRHYIAEVAEMEHLDEEKYQDAENQYAGLLLESDHKSVFGQSYLEYKKRSPSDCNSGQQVPPKGARYCQTRNNYTNAYSNNMNENRTSNGWQSYPASGQSHNQTYQYARHGGQLRRGIS